MKTLIAPAQTPAFKKYLSDVSAWHGYVRFLGLPSLQTNPDIPIEELYVPLALSESQIKPDEDPSKWSTIDPVIALAKYRRLVILGDPGSGKSTLINWFAWYLASGFSRRLEGNLEKCLPVPFVLRDLDLTNVNDFDSLIDSLLQRPVAEALKANKDALYDYIHSGQALLLFDGLDEISNEKRIRIRRIIHEGMDHFPNCYYLFTSRIVGYDEVPLENEGNPSNKFDILQSRSSIGSSEKKLALVSSDSALEKISNPPTKNNIKIFYVAPFNDDQVSLFALNWYREQGGPDTEARQLSQSFASAIRSTDTTNQLARIPNLLTMMALIFRVRAQLPDGTALLYEDIAQAYLESIDSARQLKDEFSWLRKKRWLARVGFEMQMQRVEQLDSHKSQELLVSRQQVLDWISDAMIISGDIASVGYAEKYLDWIAKRSGLLVPRGENQFAFLHLSFQEYFCAVYVKQQLENPDWRTPAEDSEGVLDSRAARSELEKWATVSVWHQTLVFIFELFAGMPGWSKTLMGIFFPKQWNSIERLEWYSSDRSIFWFLGNEATIQLRCWLQIICNPHSGLQQAQRDSLFIEAFNLALEQQKMLGADSNKFWSKHIKPNILTHLLRSEQYGEKTITSLEQHKNILRLTLTDVDAQRFKKIISVLKELEQLCVDNLKTEDLNLVAELYNLKDLTLASCKLDDLKILENLHSLTALSLDNSTILNPDALENLPSLENLGIDNTNIFNLNPLRNQKNIRRFSADGTKIQDLKGLENCTQLISLSIQSTPIKDFSTLASFNNLVHLYTSNTSFSDLRIISNASLLQSLLLNRTKIETLDGISSLSNLVYLSLSNTPVSDLTPLSELNLLEHLMLDDTAVDNIAPLASLKRLKRIDLDNTKLSSISSLAKISSLEHISIRNTKVRNIGSLERLPNLKSLDIEGTAAKATPAGARVLESIRSRK